MGYDWIMMRNKYKILAEKYEQIGMSVLKEGSELNNRYNYVEVYNMIKQQFGDFAGIFFWEWVFELHEVKDVFEFWVDSHMSLEENVRRLWNNMVEVATFNKCSDFATFNNSMSRKEAIEQARTWLNDYIERFKKTEAGKDFLKAQDTYNKGTQVTGGEWDISGLEENAKGKTSKKQILTDLEKKFKFIDPYSPEDPINLYSILQQEFGACADSFFKGIGWRYSDSFEENLEYLWDVAFVEDYNEALEKGMDEEEAKKKCLELALYFLEIDYFKKFRESEAYKDCLKAQDIYNKGTQATNGDWDMSGLEENFKFVDPNWPEDSINLYNILRQEFGACADVFFKKIDFGYEDPPESFEENLNLLWDIVFVRNYTKAHEKIMHIGTEEEIKKLEDEAKKKCLELALRKLEVNYFRKFRKSQAYKDCLKAQAIYNKGTQATNGDWDMSGLEENKKLNDPYNSAEIIVIVKQRFGACADAFWKWLYEENFGDFDSDLSFKENIRSFWENMVENGIDSGMSKRRSIEQAQNYLNEYIEMFEGSEAYKDCLKAQDIYNKGTQATNGEWDMTGLEESRKEFFPLNRIISGWFSTKEQKKDFVLYLYRALEITPDMFGRPLSPIRMVEIYWDETYDQRRDDLFADYEDDNEVNRVAYNQTLKELEAMYEEYKKVKDIYDKGTQATGGDWDMTGLEETYQQVMSEWGYPFDSDKADRKLHAMAAKLLRKMLGIKDAKEIDGIIRYVEKVVGPEVGREGWAYWVLQKYVFEYINKNLPSWKEIYPRLSEHMVPDFPYPPIIKKAIADSFKQLYEEYKKIKDIHDKGTQATNGEWDMSGLEEAYQQVVSESRDPSRPPALVDWHRSETVDLLNKILGIKDAKEAKDIIRYIEEVVGPSLGYDDYAIGVMQKYVFKYINKNLPSWRKIAPSLSEYMNLKYGYWPPKIKKAIADSFKQLYEEYKKVKDIHDKGTQATGGDWDMTGLEEEDTSSKIQSISKEEVNVLVQKCKQVIRYLYNPKNISSMDIRMHRLDQLEKQLNFLNDLKSLFFLARHSKIIFGGWPGYESWINFIEEQYKVIDILNKGTAATNGEWDMTGL
jgi:inhibitor of KinA sporulation pathway (predicted exonuclease)